MFLTVKDYTIPDFLSALGFIAPKGMSLEYIVAPDSISDDTISEIEENGFEEQPAPEVTNIKYLKKDLKQTHSFSQKTNPITDPDLLPPEMPKAAPVPMDPTIGNNNTVWTPKRAIQIVECKDDEYGYTVALREDFCNIPKNTIFVMRNLQE